MKHFNSTEIQGSVKCSYCPKTMKFDGSNSTGIERHLKNYHKKEYSVFDKEKKEEKAKAVNKNNNIVKGKRRIQETKPKEGQPKMKQSKFSWNIVDKELQKRWDNSIVEYAADSFSSYAQLSSKAFKDLIRIANKLIKVKSRQTLSRHIKKKAINILNRIAKQLKKEKGSLRSLGFTTDMWTSRTGDSFISLTVSYIDQNWKLRRWTPFVKFFPTDSPSPAQPSVCLCPAQPPSTGQTFRSELIARTLSCVLKESFFIECSGHALAEAGTSSGPPSLPDHRGLLAPPVFESLGTSASPLRALGASACLLRASEPAPALSEPWEPVPAFREPKNQHQPFESLGSSTGF